MSEMQTERRVPEHPGWQPWWLRYAEYEGVFAVLIDREGLPDPHRCEPPQGKYGVGVANVNSRAKCWCGGDDSAFYWRIGTSYYSLAEAEAAFELACERLREGG